MLTQVYRTVFFIDTSLFKKLKYPLFSILHYSALVPRDTVRIEQNSCFKGFWAHPMISPSLSLCLKYQSNFCYWWICQLWWYLDGFIIWLLKDSRSLWHGSKKKIWSLCTLLAQQWQQQHAPPLKCVLILLLLNIPKCAVLKSLEITVAQAGETISWQSTWSINF